MESGLVLKRLPRLGLLLVASSLQACNADTFLSPQSWPTECVGRMQLQLPGVADTAATFNSKVRNFKDESDLNRPSFPDGTPAPFANSMVIISHPLSDLEKKRLLGFAEIEKVSVISSTLKEKKIARANSAFMDVEFSAKEGVGWRYKDYLSATYFAGDSLMRWASNVEFGEVFLKARPRPIFEIPKDSGICLPYVFVPDNGKRVRNISMSYRLKDHPDIQITLTDSSAYRPEESSIPTMSDAEIKHRNKQAEPDPAIAGFWGQWLTVASKYESQWAVPSTTRAVTLAGFKGLQSFVLLTMDDGTTKNYGYFAVVRGQPDAAEDTPDLRLIVQQDITQAQGKTPLTKDQFIEMAQAIAKSVQRRPVAAN